MLLSLELKTSSMMSLSASGRTKEKGTMERKKSGVHTVGRDSTLKKNLDESTSLLEINHINILERFRRRYQQDQEP